MLTLTKEQKIKLLLAIQTSKCITTADIVRRSNGIWVIESYEFDIVLKSTDIQRRIVVLRTRDNSGERVQQEFLGIQVQDPIAKEELISFNWVLDKNGNTPVNSGARLMWELFSLIRVLWLRTQRKMTMSEVAIITGLDQ